MSSQTERKPLFLAVSTDAAPFRVVVVRSEDEWERTHPDVEFAHTYFVDRRPLSRRTPDDVARMCAREIASAFRSSPCDRSDLRAVLIALVGARSRDVARHLVCDELGPQRSYVCTWDEARQAEHDSHTLTLVQLREQALTPQEKRQRAEKLNDDASV